jgi:organic radical activating enzyme
MNEMNDDKNSAGRPPPKRMDFQISEHEKNLIELIRDLDYGEVHVVIKGGEPIQADKLKKTVRL